jgi:excisionase family DNA binding protein
MDDLLTPEQAAAILQVSPKTLKDWLRAGKLTGCKIGRFWRVKAADLRHLSRHPADGAGERAGAPT